MGQAGSSGGIFRRIDRRQHALVLESRHGIVAQTQLQTSPAHVDIFDVELQLLTGREPRECGRSSAQFKSIDNPFKTRLNPRENAKLGYARHHPLHLLPGLIAFLRVRPRVYGLLLVQNAYLFLVLLFVNGAVLLARIVWPGELHGVGKQHRYIHGRRLVK